MKNSYIYDYKQLFLLKKDLLEFLGRKRGILWGIKIDKVESVGKPTDCIGCGLCASHCPQSIDIPDIMQKLAELM